MGHVLRRDECRENSRGMTDAEGRMDTAGSHTLTVLVVDDDDDMRALVRARLAHDPHLTVVAEAASGAQAVALAKRHRPDVVILDVMMPVLDGARTLPLIRAVAPRAAIVTFSAFSERHPRVEQVADSDGHVCKTDSATLPAALHRAWLARTARLAG
jgi:DNA-binding NarL/FixJ family response regulator